MYIYICICTCTHVYVRIYIYIHTYTYTYIYMYIYIYICPSATRAANCKQSSWLDAIGKELFPSENRGERGGHKMITARYESCI